jgi:hypothetical protein
MLSDTTMTFGQRVGAFLSVARQPRSYGNIIYGLMAFPLGLCYFILLVTGLSLGLGTLIVWVGIPILLAVGGICWGLAALERAMAITLLGVDVPPMAQPQPSNTTLWERFKAHVSNPTTWKSLGYLSLKFPYGLFSFVMMVTLVATSLAFIFAPLMYVLQTWLFPGWGDMGHNTIITVFPAAVIDIDGQFRLGDFLALLADLPLGLLLGLLTLHAANGMAWLWGEFARVALGTERPATTPTAATQV